MIYLRQTEELKKYISSVKTHLGCRSSCKMNLISIDEFNLLFMLLKKQGAIVGSEEIEKIKKKAKHIYFHSTHICTQPADDDEDNETTIEELLKDKVFTREEPIFKSKLDYDAMDNRQKEEKQSIGKALKQAETSVGFGLNLLFGLFLIAYGAFQFCKSYMEMEFEPSLLVTLVVSIVTLLAETMLVIIRLGKNAKVTEDDSFAYKFNKNYRLSKMKAEGKGKKVKQE